MMDTQIVYVLINAAMPGMVKIGVTTQTDLDQRLRQLYTTGVPVPFECYYACRVPSDKKVETNLHFAFGACRVNPNREFFRIEPERVKAVLEMLKIDDVTSEVEQELGNDVSAVDKNAAEQIRKRRPVMNFKEMEIPPGSPLIFKDGTSVTVADDRCVIYKGESRYLTSVTQEILGKDRAIQPSPLWSFHGRTLAEIYEETYGDQRS
jgi:hypothetical protein